MKKWFKKYKYLLPIFLLVASFLSIFFKYDIYGYVLLGNLIGWSIPISVYLVLDFTIDNNYCFITRLSPVALLLLNLIDIVGFYFDENFYNFTYVVVVTSIVFSLSLIHHIKKMKK